MARARSRRWKGALGAGAIACSGAACSFVTSFDGLTSASADAAPPNNGTFGDEDSGGSVSTGADAGRAEDAGLDAFDDATPFTGADADATVGSDGASEVDASDGGKFCATLDPAPLFCDDFDETPLATPWDQVTTSGGTVTLGSKDFTSPPFAMLVTETAGVAAIDLCGYKSFTSAATKKTYTLSFDLNVLQADPSAATSDAILAALQLDVGGRPAWDLQLELSYDTTKGALDVNLSENASFSDGGHLYTPHRLPLTLLVGAWTRVSLVVVIGTSDAAAIAFGGKTQVSIAVNPGTTNAYPEILVGGAFAEKSAQGWTVGYDDVTFDAR